MKKITLLSISALMLSSLSGCYYPAPAPVPVAASPAPIYYDAYGHPVYAPPPAYYAAPAYYGPPIAVGVGFGYHGGWRH